MNTQDNYLSLFEFLGKPAGGELGKQVFEAAKKAKIRLNTRQVANPKYTGSVMTYPQPFLEQYFKENNYQVY